mmetsp:Transcript_98333/g.305876  ORF Transcript_98333/g.305876 Transcript_98333/m.305876 type:complete len:645 (-) Transcript_98333:212-2146(-)
MHGLVALHASGACKGACAVPVTNLVVPPGWHKCSTVGAGFAAGMRAAEHQDAGVANQAIAGAGGAPFMHARSVGAVTADHGDGNYSGRDAGGASGFGSSMGTSLSGAVITLPEPCSSGSREDSVSAVLHVLLGQVEEMALVSCEACVDEPGVAEGRAGHIEKREALLKRRRHELEAELREALQDEMGCLLLQLARACRQPASRVPGSQGPPATDLQPTVAEGVAARAAEAGRARRPQAWPCDALRLQGEQPQRTAEAALACSHGSELEAARQEARTLQAQLRDMQWLQSSSRMSVENARLRMGAEAARAEARQEVRQVQGLESELSCMRQESAEMEVRLRCALQASQGASQESRLLRGDLAERSREAAAWRERASAAAAAEALAGVESWQARELLRGEAASLRRGLRGACEASEAAGRRGRALEAELRHAAERLRESAEAGASAEARLEVAGRLDGEAWAELGSLRARARGLQRELRAAGAPGPSPGLGTLLSASCEAPPAQAHPEAQAPRLTAEQRATLGSVQAALDSSLSALHGLQAHANALRATFEMQHAPALEAVQTTWRYVRDLELVNHRWAGVRAEYDGLLPTMEHSAGRGLSRSYNDGRGGPGSWLQIVSEAACAEKHVRAVAGRFQALLNSTTAAR